MNFSKNEAFIDSISLAPADGEELLELAAIPTSKDVTGIEIRLSKVLIKDNGTTAIWPFPGLAKMYLMTIVVSDLQDAPISLDLKGFQKVGDNEELPIDRTLFFWQQTEATAKVPSQIHVFASVIKSKEGLRDAGTILSKVKGDSEYKDLVTNITALVSKATPVGAVSDALFTAASIVGKYLSEVKDKPWFTWVQSFTNINGDMDNIGSTIRGRESDKVAMALNLIVRDKGREEIALKDMSEEQALEHTT